MLVHLVEPAQERDTSGPRVIRRGAHARGDNALARLGGVFVLGQQVLGIEGVEAGHGRWIGVSGGRRGRILAEDQVAGVVGEVGQAERSGRVGAGLGQRIADPGRRGCRRRGGHGADRRAGDRFGGGMIRTGSSRCRAREHPGDEQPDSPRRTSWRSHADRYRQSSMSFLVVSSAAVSRAACSGSSLSWPAR